MYLLIQKGAYLPLNPQPLPLDCYKTESSQYEPKVKHAVHPI